MLWKRRTWIALAAASGFVGVAAGALGAHGVGDTTAKDWARTGSNYQLIHAVAALASAGLVTSGVMRARHAPVLFLGGTVLFSGALYAMALGAPRWLGGMVPLGGLLFMAGWAVLVWAAIGSGLEQP